MSAFSVKAQIPTNYYEGKDAFRHYPSLMLSQTIETKTMPKFDVNVLLEEDRTKEGIGPLRFGYSFDVNYSLQDGTWEERGAERIWSMKFVSSGAFSLNFVFDEFYLPPGAQLYVFNTKGTMVYGPVTDKNIPQDVEFWTNIIAGDEVVIQLSESKTGKEQSRLHISSVVHGYKNTFPFDTNDSPSSSRVLGCHNDVTCSTWLNEADAVMRIMVSDKHLCTGSLLNNTSQDYRPFVLTAFHCLDGDCNGTLSSTEKSNVNNWKFSFQYRSKTCNGSTYTDFSYNGADFRSAWYTSDFALVELKNRITDNRIIFLGWDRSGTTSTTGTTIHHPEGSLMKISYDYQSPTTNSSLFSLINPCWGINSYAANNFWVSGLDNGAIEGGSSGAPFFNTDRRVIGQLLGGNVTCPNPSSTVYFGQFHRSWTGGGTNDTRLSNWLNYHSSGNQTVNTIRYYAVTGPTTVCTTGSVFTIQNLSSSATVSWVYDNTKLNLTPGPGNDKATISAKSGAIGEAIFHPVINGIPTAPKTIYANFIGTSGLVINLNVARYQTIQLDPPSDYYPDATNYAWEWSYPNSNPTGVTLNVFNKYATVYFSSTGVYTLFAKAINACGTSPGPTIIYNLIVGRGSSGSSFYYPNPVSDVFTVDLDDFAASQGQTLQSQQTVPVYDVRLYDSMGNLKLQQQANGGTIQLNVSKLPNGIYFLHISEGSNGTPETFSIVVQH